MVIIQFALGMFSLSLLIAAALAPPEAWLTPLRKASDNEVGDDGAKCS